ncbi:MAG: hypothetical protein R3B90_13190 [Planctomycetaceae bacterium]
MSDELLREWQPGQVRDLNRDMTRYMLRLTSRILFGIDQTELAYHIGELTERWVEWNHKLGPAAFSSNPASQSSTTTCCRRPKNWRWGSRR